MRCPICDKSFEPTESNTLPFCSERCRTVDLGRWLGETYSLPLESVPPSDSEPAEEDSGPRKGQPRNVP
jgi:endogenous inhibitor of DNA gyrase (YacG/DUF329 family)